MNSGILNLGMLLYNSWNAFYPSYILNHHFSVYLQILNMITSQTGDKQMKDLM